MIARLREVSYRYPGAAAPALECVTLSIERGEYVLVAGRSAGGKSTLLRVFNGLVPQFHGGSLRGRVEVAGLDPSRTPARTMATVAGFVFQEPEAQAIVDSVEDEIAFGMEQRAVAAAEMRQRVDGLLPALGIEPLRFRRLASLSGGERQRVAIAAVLALEPDLLLLDEPTSQLDPDGAESVLAAVDSLRRTRGITVLVAEHRLARLLPAADSALLAERGRVTRLTPQELAAAYHGAPEVCRLARRLGIEPVPLTVEEARARFADRFAAARVETASPPPEPGDELLAVSGINVSFGEFRALNDVDLTLREGEIVALIGGNGSGKSTLFRTIAGLVTPDSGSISLARHPAAKRTQERTAIAGLVPQNPATALSQETVEREIGETLRARKLAGHAVACAAWGLTHLAGRDPRDLSVGQQQRVAVAAMLAHEPPVWLLDEPTRGADEETRQWLAERLRRHAGSGGATIVATHDLEAAARFATRVVRLDRGRVVFDLPARAAFGSGGPCATATAQLVPGAVLPEEVRL